MTTFADFGLAKPILKALDREGYENPTPIQEQAIPNIMEGKDILGIAQTGTGKTAAFVLPILDKLAKEPIRMQGGSCGTLILAPTRELAAQIHDNIRKYGRQVRPTTALIVGGAKYPPQIRALRAGADIVVATPGRLMDHIESETLKLDHTTTIVLDEADQMLDLGFMPVIRTFLSMLPEERQLVLLSATMAKQIRSLASDFLRSPVDISVAPESTPMQSIEQSLILIDQVQKREKLAELLSAPDIAQAIVFTKTKYGSDKVAKFLKQLGVEAESIHGDKSQGQRQRILRNFKSGQTTVLVATDVAARGLDIPSVSHVFNFELPNVPEAYVHRIGRTGRAGKSGVAISLVAPTEKNLLKSIEKLIGDRIFVTESLWSKKPKGAFSKPKDKSKSQDKPKKPFNKRGPKRDDKPQRSKKDFEKEVMQNVPDQEEGQKQEKRKPSTRSKPFSKRPQKAKQGGNSNDKPFAKRKKPHRGKSDERSFEQKRNNKAERSEKPDNDQAPKSFKKRPSRGKPAANGHGARKRPNNPNAKPVNGKSFGARKPSAGKPARGNSAGRKQGQGKPHRGKPSQSRPAQGRRSRSGPKS